jgi:hypothetical protein
MMSCESLLGTAGFVWLKTMAGNRRRKDARDNREYLMLDIIVDLNCGVVGHEKLTTSLP